MPSTPTVMVSSTFYDLTQIRQDLYGFIANELGYEPLLSEHKSFPIDPGLDTIPTAARSCRRADGRRSEAWRCWRARRPAREHPRA